MPSSATITAFYSFTANSRARASQVNANFSIFRGHILPVDPNTQTAVNNTYDLGSSEYMWRYAYSGRVYPSLTTTAQAYITGDTAGTGLALYDGSTLIKRFSNAFVQATSTAQAGQIAVSYHNTITYFSGTSLGITGLTITISTSGKPVEIRLFSGVGSYGGVIEVPGNTLKVNILRGASTISSCSINQAGYYPVGGFNAIDVGLAAGTYNYSVEVRGQTTTANVIGQTYIVAKEVS